MHPVASSNAHRLQFFAIKLVKSFCCHELCILISSAQIGENILIYDLFSSVMFLYLPSHGETCFFPPILAHIHFELYPRGITFH